MRLDFPVEVVRDDGRVTKRYPYANVATPYEKLRSLDDAERFLKPGVSFAELDALALSVSDLGAAARVNASRTELFRAIERDGARGQPVVNAPLPIRRLCPCRTAVPQAHAERCPRRRSGPSSRHLGNLPSPTWTGYPRPEFKLIFVWD